MPSLAGCLDRKEALNLLEQAARGMGRNAAAGNAGDGRWLLAHAMRAEAWPRNGEESAFLTRRELDEAVPDRPCVVMSFDHHSACANSAAFAAASGVALEDSHGIVVRDELGEPTGTLLELAAWRMWSLAPEPTEEERVEHVRAALRDFAAHGFREVHDLRTPPWMLDALERIAREDGRLATRVGLFAPVEDLDEAVVSRMRAQAEAISATLRQSTHTKGEGVRLLGGKLFADGTLNACTAHVLEAFRDAPAGLEHGKPMVTARELDAALERCDGLGLQLSVHAIGDGAVRAVLDAHERHLLRSGATTERRAPLLRIEHCEVVDRRDVPRFAEMGVIASVQPCHLLYDIEALTRRLPHRLDRVLPLREMIDSGLVPGETLLMGSDAPIVRPNPMDSVVAATMRRRMTQMDGSNPGGAPTTTPIAPEQAITAEEAWAGFGPPGINRPCGA